MGIGDRIKARRESFDGFTQEKLAKLVGYQSRSAINKIELNKREVSPSMVIKLAEALKTSPAYLMGWVDNPELTHEQTLQLEEHNNLEVLASDISSNTPIPITKQKEDFLTYDNIYPIVTKKLPLLGEVACGKPIFAPEDADAYVVANSNIKADFALQARGDSMINARIYDGDMVFIHEQPIVENGEIAAVAIDNEVTLKHVYYYPEQGKLILTPENPMYEPMVYIGEELNSIRILGKAVAFMSNI